MVKSDRIKNFWIAFFAVLSLVAIAFGVVTTVTTSNKAKQMRLSTVSDENYYKIMAENNLKQSLYLACDDLKNIDASLGKVAISNDKGHQAQLLSRVSMHASDVNTQLATLPIEQGEALSSCEKFTNQTQDYATYLVGKLANGESLTQTERNSLKNLQRVARNLYDVFEQYSQNDSGMFITNGTGLGGVGDLTDGLNSAQEDAFEYEKLIYDGPFSDSVEQKEYQCGKKISAKEGGEIVNEYFGENKFLHKINTKCPMFVYQTQKGEVVLTADGKVIEYDGNQSYEGTPSVKKQDCIKIAQEFCQKLGYDVQGVWVSKLQDYVIYVNCATVTEGVIVYPELIKVAVDTITGDVVGLEAKAYLTNHTQRQIKFGDVDKDTAQKTLDTTLKVTNVAKALIEIKNKEYFCYEFECHDGANVYYVYVDSATGKEVEVLKVIQNTEGHTVI